MTNWTRADKLALIGIMIMVFAAIFACIGGISALFVVPEVRHVVQTRQTFKILFKGSSVSHSIISVFVRYFCERHLFV